MSWAGKFLTHIIPSIRLGEEVVLAAKAGTTGNILVLLRDNSFDILLATGTDVPTDATSGYAKGCTFIDRDVATGSTGRYENVGTNTSCVFTALSATASEINTALDGNTATAAEITQAADISTQNVKIVPSSVITASAAAVKQSVIQHGDIIETTLWIDLTGLKSVATAGDIIGDTGVSYIAQITAAVNGTIFAGEMGCSEVPTTGDDDIDLYSATEATGAYDGAIGDLTETALVDAGGAHAIGTVKPLTALPAANAYLYLTAGAGDTAGTYDAGQIYIKLLGYA